MVDEVEWKMVEKYWFEFWEEGRGKGSVECWVMMVELTSALGGGCGLGIV